MTVRSQRILSLMATGIALTVGSQAARAVVLDAPVIEQKVLVHVREQLATQVSKTDQSYVSVRVIKVPAAPFDFPTLTKADDIKITATSPLAENYSDRSIVRVHMETPDGHSRDIGVPVSITVKKPVWVVKNPVNANAPLSASDLSLETRNVSQTYSHTVGQERDLSRYIARVNLQPGDVLDSRKIIIPPDVRCNDEVRILLNSNDGMTVTVPGIALSNGRIGETIRVRQTVMQRKYFTAKIIDKNRVQVDM